MATNTGSLGSSLAGTFPAASSAFAPTNTLAFGPLSYNDSASRNDTFMPTGRGADSMNVTVTSDGGDSTITLAGTGVGPVFDSSVAPGSTIDFGTVWGVPTIMQLQITNATPDGNLGDLTDLTLLSVNYSGVAGFLLPRFVPGTVLAAGNDYLLDVLFDPSLSTGGPDPHTGTFTILTDQGVAFGIAGGQAYNYQVSAVVPEPSTLLLLLLAAACAAPCVRRRRR